MKKTLQEILLLFTKIDSLVNLNLSTTFRI